MRHVRAGQRIDRLVLVFGVVAAIALAAFFSAHAAVAASDVSPRTGVLPASAVASTTSSSAPQFRGHPAENAGYDEQIGLTFTQNFTSLLYNVTAVEQVDPTLGTGPGYLLSGLSNIGYWYQVGLSYDWSPGAGFAMSYEAFDPQGVSIFPTNGGGGLVGFSGAVDPGDNVTLLLSFTSGQVTMKAYDTQTGAVAEETYSAVGGTTFVGEPNGDANSIGFFTGLMTEWYHGEPYFNNEAEVLYSTNSSVSSGWMWMDEFNAGNGQLVFTANDTSLSTFTSPSPFLQEFSYEGITEYSGANEFVTGALSSPTVTSTSISSSSSSSSGSGGGSTITITQAVTQTTTVSVPTTVTETSVSTEPVTTTVTSNQSTTITTVSTSTPPPSTTTQTVTTTQTAVAHGLASLPGWGYGLMAGLLLVGVGVGYLLRRPAPGSPALT